MAIVADVNADLGKSQIKNWETQVSGPEIELLPKAGRDVGNVRLAVFAEIGSVMVDHCGRIVVNTFLLAFVDGNDQRQVMAPRLLLHQVNGGAVGHRLREVIPFGGLFRAKIRAVKNFL